jgi:hypothetical protein
LISLAVRYLLTIYSVDKLQELDTQRKELTTDLETKQPPTENGEVKDEEDTTMLDASEINGGHVSSEGSGDEAPRPLRRGQVLNQRKRKREEEAARKEKARKQKETATKLSRSESKLKKVQAEMQETKEEIKECEEQIADYTNQLRETDCQRTKSLGRDRFCNRYFWFERNGMPFTGMPESSTAHYGYANGRLWVQGPDPLETEGYTELSADDELRYKGVYGTTLEERKKFEEGETRLPDSFHWGFIDDAATLDDLIAWLDERGLRERALRKELINYRDYIAETMTKLKEHKDEESERKASNESETSQLRISTRTKTYTELDTNQWGCLNWQNSSAVRKFGRKHSEEGRKTRKKAAEKVEKAPKILLDRRGKPTRKR